MSELALERNENLPKGWAYTTLEEISVTLRAGGTPSTQVSEYYSDGKIPFVKIDDMTSSIKYLDKTKIFINEKGLKNSSAWIVPENSILYSMYASYGIPIINKIPVATSQAIIAYIPFPKLINLEYVYYYLQSIKSKLKPKGTTQGNLNARFIREIKIKLSPLNEQKRIISKIEELFSILDQNLQLLLTSLKQIESHNKSFLIRAFSGDMTREWRTKHKEIETGTELLRKIREVTLNYSNLNNEENKRKKLKLFYRDITTEERNRWSIPPTWGLCYLGNIVETRGGIQKTPERKPIKNFFPYLRVANVYRNFLDLDEMENFEISTKELETYCLKYGDVLIVEGNGSRNEIGRCALWRNEIQNCLHQNHIIRCRPYYDIPGEYIVDYLNSPTGIKQLFAVASSTSGLYTLSVNKINNIIIPIPPKEEQKVIFQEVERRLTISQNNLVSIKTNIHEVSRLRKSILTSAFRGNLVCQDPNDEPVEILLQKIKQEKQTIMNQSSKNRGRKNVK